MFVSLTCPKPSTELKVLDTKQALQEMRVEVRLRLLRDLAKTRQDYYNFCCINLVTISKIVPFNNEETFKNWINREGGASVP